ncbi:hypothetical protein [Streptomyces sp. NPDC088733]|uniref:hypothetical protein n=1 Tax=Streptomyces sp. NPDC088733 TaxID=3365880 RepID=UPI0038068793
MGDPLLWRAGSGDLATWLGGVQRLLLGEAVAGYTVRSGPVFPDYGDVIHQAADTGDLARFLAGRGVDALRATTRRGARQDEPAVEYLVEGRTGAGALRVTSSGERAGSVRLHAPVTSPAALADWLHRLSPLLPVPVPRRSWSATPLAEPLAVTLHQRAGTIVVALESLDTGPGTGGVRPSDDRLLVTSRPRALAEDTALLASPAALERRRVGTGGDLGQWLAALDGATPAPTGRAARAALPRTGMRAQVWRIEHGTPLLMIGRAGGPEVMARGPVDTLQAWSRPLLSPAVHGRAAAPTRRRLAAWLRAVGEAVFGGPAAWSFGDAPAPVGTDDLAVSLSRAADPRAPGVDRLAPGSVTLRGAVTAAGPVGVTGRPAP